MAKRATKSRKEYEKLKRSAYELVVVKGKTQKEAAEQLGVSEQSVSEWAREGNWRDERKARQSSVQTSTANIQRIIDLISERRLALEHEINEAQRIGDKESELRLRKEANQLSDEISKQNTYLRGIKDSNKITLGMYIDVMDDIFNALRNYDEVLFDGTIDFQAQLIRRKTNELG